MKTLILLGLMLISPVFADAKTITVCDDQEPPACEDKVVESNSSNRRGGVYFIRAIGLDATLDQAREIWANASLRAKILEIWRAQTFGN